MRFRLGLAAGWVALVVAGCGEPAARVSVDLARVPWTAPAPVPPSPEPPNISIPADTAAIPDLPARNLYLGETRARLEEAKQALERNRRVAMDNLSRRLRAELDDELARIESERTEALAPARAERMDRLFGELRTTFEDFAREIGPLRWRLAELNGFPDVPGQGSDEAAGIAVARRAVESRELRSSILHLETEYRRRVDERLAAVGAEADAELGRIRTEMAELRDRMEREIDRIVQGMARESLQLLAKGSMVESNRVLPPVRGSKVELPATRPLAPGPSMPPAIDDRRTWLASEAKIWAASRGYRLASPGPGVRDATEEFVRWRQKQSVGP